MQESETIDKMAAGYSTQAKISNQFWLVLIVVTIFVLITKPGQDGKINAPLEWGPVDKYRFYTITTILLSVLLMAYTSAMTHTIRTRMLAQRFIDKLTSKKFSNGIFIQDYFDSIISPTYNRVAPISQILLGKNQFRHEGKQPVWRRWSCVLLYILLKLFTFVLLYLIPVWALYISYNSRGVPVDDFKIADWILKVVIGVAIFCVVVLWGTDIKYTFRVVDKILKAQKSDEDAASGQTKSITMPTSQVIKKKVINTGLFNITISFGKD